MRYEFSKLLNDDEDIEEFENWAFGDNPGSLDLSLLVDRWNERHGDKYLINPHNKPLSDAPHMINLWREENN